MTIQYDSASSRSIPSVSLYPAPGQEGDHQQIVDLINGIQDVIRQTNSLLYNLKELRAQAIERWASTTVLAIDPGHENTGVFSVKITVDTGDLPGDMDFQAQTGEGSVD